MDATEVAEVSIEGLIVDTGVVGTTEAAPMHPVVDTEAAIGVEEGVTRRIRWLAMVFGGVNLDHARFCHSRGL